MKLLFAILCLCTLIISYLCTKVIVVKDEDKEIENYYNEAPEHNEQMNVKGFRNFLMIITFLIIVIFICIML